MVTVAMAASPTVMKPKTHSLVKPFTKPQKLLQYPQMAERAPAKGILYSYTIVYDVPAGFEEQAPYPLGLIELDDGNFVEAQLTDLDFIEKEVP